MYTALQHTHSFIAGIVLVLLVASVIFSAINIGKVANDRLRRIALFTLIASHTQLIVGLILYFLSPYFKGFLENPGETMKDSTLRMYVVEHPLTMIVVVILVTIGYSKIKKLVANGGKVRGKNFAYYLLALILTLLMIPWKQWLG